MSIHWSQFKSNFCIFKTDSESKQDTNMIDTLEKILEKPEIIIWEVKKTSFIIVSAISWNIPLTHFEVACFERSHYATVVFRKIFVLPLSCNINFEILQCQMAYVYIRKLLSWWSWCTPNIDQYNNSLNKTGLEFTISTNKLTAF